MYYKYLNNNWMHDTISQETDNINLFIYFQLEDVLLSLMDFPFREDR